MESEDKSIEDAGTTRDELLSCSQDEQCSVTPALPEDDAAQEPSLANVEQTEATIASNAAVLSSINNVQQQEPSLLQMVASDQEPSLAYSSTSADGSSAATDAAEIDEPSASPSVAITSNRMQDLSSSPDDAAVTAAEAAALQGAASSSAVLSSDTVHHHDPGEPPTAAGTSTASAAVSSAGQTVAVQGAADGARQQDKSYFVDGIRAIDVEVDCGPGVPCKLLHVMMDVTAVQQIPKPFLGGYKHKQNGVTYHHASSQTPQQPKQQASKGKAAVVGADGVVVVKQKLSRETQTVKAASTSSQTVREAATQMARPGLELDDSEDRVLTPRPYISAARVGEWRLSAVLTIQRFSRGWMARRRAAALKEIKAERDGFLAQAAAEREAAAIANRSREVEHRTHPLTAADFHLLSHELETWRQQQTAAIKAAGAASEGQQDFDQQAALQLLLAKETRLLQTLDKLRVNARHENKALNTEKVLNNLSSPKTWTLSNGKKVMVHTPTTVRAAELQQLYRGLTLLNLSLDERLDVLLHVKWAVKEFDCALTRELVELIDREADLLNRGRSPKTLDGLRRRISGQFLAFCKTPDFNPEAARLQLVPGGLNEPETFEYVDDVVGYDAV